MRNIVSLFVFILIYSNTYSQTGKVEGRVIDVQTGKPLAGVSITSADTNKGVASDMDGKFILTLPASRPLIIRISSVGYKTKEVENVEVAPNELINLDFVIEPATKTEAEIVIKTTGRQETAVALIAYQKNTNTVAQVVSAESIKRSPDKNTSEVLKRIPGTSIQEGKYIIVRGLNDRYNQAMLNGILLGTTEPDRKTFSFDIFPAGLVDNIIVNKAFVPEFSAEWAGGLVQVNTKDVPAKNYLNITLGTGFNTQTIGKDFYTYKGGEIDFLGMDDGFRAIPAELPVRSKYNSMERAEKTELGKLFKNVWAADKSSSRFLPALNSNFQLSGGFNKKLGGNNKLGAVFAVNYSKSNKRIDYINNRLFIINNLIPSITFDYSDKKYSQDILWAPLLILH